MTSMGFGHYAEWLSLPYQKDHYQIRFTELHGMPTELVKQWKKQPPAGIITEELGAWTDKILELEVPTVVISRDFGSGSSIGICCDDLTVGNDAGNYLLSLGFQHFAFVGDGYSYSTNRRSGFSETLQKKGIQHFDEFTLDISGVNYLEYNRISHEGLDAWLKSLPLPCALFSASDQLARLICDVSLDSKIAIPQDLAVLSVSNSLPLCLLSHPEISTIPLPRSSFGKIATNTLLKLISGEIQGGQTITVPPAPLQIRESSDVFAIKDPDACRALHWLRSNYQNPVSIETLCNTLHLNRRKLERTFKKHLHHSPWEELFRLRVEKAKELLAHTHFPIDRIAEESGFCNASHLSTALRKACNTSPLKYRQRYEAIR